MAGFPNLERIIPAVEDAQIVYDLRTTKFMSDADLVAETAEFNRTLERAASAVLADLNDPALSEPYLEEWRPKNKLDTWFGPDPAAYLRYVLQNGSLHRVGMPDTATIH